MVARFVPIQDNFAVACVVVDRLVEYADKNVEFAEVEFVLFCGTPRPLLDLASEETSSIEARGILGVGLSDASIREFLLLLGLGFIPLIRKILFRVSVIDPVKNMALTDIKSPCDI